MVRPGELLLNLTLIAREFAICVLPELQGAPMENAINRAEGCVSRTTDAGKSISSASKKSPVTTVVFRLVRAPAGKAKNNARAPV
jgi:hypothetical protein